MKRTRTNTANQLDVAIKTYLINAIDCDYLNIDENSSINEKIAAVKSSFNNEYSFRVDQVGEHQALVEWLQGLPGVINIFYMNDDILNFADSIGSIDLKQACDKEKDMIIDGWFELLANKLGQLFRAYRVPKQV